jgi:hypothetical protein
MQYLILGCDMAGDEPLRPQFEDSPPVPELAPELEAALRSWNQRMAHQIVKVSDANAEMAALNAEGQALAERVVSELSGTVKIKYINE